MTDNSHLYSGETNLHKMIALVQQIQALYKQTGRTIYFQPGDVIWQMFRFTWVDPERNVRLWEDDRGNLRGFIWHYPPHRIAFELHPREVETDLMDQMLEWAEVRRQDSLLRNEDDANEPITTSVYADDQPVIAKLESHGYTFDGADYYYYERDLTDELSAGQLPDGFIVRSVDHANELTKRVEVHQKAFNSTKVTVKSYQNLINAPGFNRDLDLVAVAPDGSFASFCIGWLDQVNKVGYVEPMGTHPDYQRRGLGKTVLLEAFRRMQAHGMTTANIVSETDNEASCGLYKSVGFRVINTVHSYVKK